MRVGVARGGLDLLLVCLGLAEPQVLLDRAVEQVGVLMHDGDHSAHRLGVERPQIMAADADRSALRIEQAQQQPRHRRFPGAARPDDAELFAGGDGEREPVMRGASPARISEVDVLESDRRNEREAGRVRRRRRPHQRLGREQGVDAGSGRLSDHALMQHHPQIPQRAEHFGAGHQYDQQRLQAHLTLRYPPHGKRQRRCGADRHPAIGDAAGHYPGRQDAQRRVAEVARLLRQPPAIGGALAERLQCRQALDAVEKLRAERLQGLLAPLAAAPLDRDEHGRRDQGDQCEDQHHRRHRHVPEGDEGEDRERGQHRDAELRHVLAEKGLQLLDPVDDRQHHPAGALAGKPGGSKFGDLVVEPAAQHLLHPAGGAVRDHDAVMVDEAAQHDSRGDAQSRQRDRDEAGIGEDMREQHAEDRKAGDAQHRGDEAQSYRRGDPAAHAAGQGP